MVIPEVNLAGMKSAEVEYLGGGTSVVGPVAAGADAGWPASTKAPSKAAATLDVLTLCKVVLPVVVQISTRLRVRIFAAKRIVADGRRLENTQLGDK
jgi:hypothetical protein